MILFSDPNCLSYESLGHPEKPERVAATRKLLEVDHPEWEWGEFRAAPLESLTLAHSDDHIQRLWEPSNFDSDTAYFDGIFEIAQLASGGALAALNAARNGKRAMSLMRPPGHHAERERIMGFCYLNHIAIAALVALDRGAKRIAIWDFDAHHGNGTQAILKGNEGIRYSSVHQHPCFPGSGKKSVDNCYNFPVAPHTPPEQHMETLRESWNSVLDFDPDVVLVSAGFDAYEHDPITQMSLRKEDFKTLGTWVGESNAAAAAVLEGGYSDDLPVLVEAFLEGWERI